MYLVAQFICFSIKIFCSSSSASRSIISFVFLFNPNVSIIDVLPDFIGYMLLCGALTRIADLNDYLYDAVKIFKRMILIDAGKWLAIFWTFSMTVVDQKNSSILLFTFVFSLLELLFLLPAYKKLFEGIIQLGYLIPNNTILSNEKKSGRIIIIGTKQTTSRIKDVITERAAVPAAWKKIEFIFIKQLIVINDKKIRSVFSPNSQ